MSLHRSVTITAPDRSGLTIADLHQFLQEADRAGVDPRTALHTRTGFKGQPLTITTRTAAQEDRR